MGSGADQLTAVPESIAPRPGRRNTTRAVRHSQAALGLGLTTAYLSIIVLLPMAALVWSSTKHGGDGFWQAISNAQSLSALELTLAVSGIVVLLNAVFGTIVAWVLVRDDFRGKAIVNALIDLPFALPTIVAGLTLLTLYGPKSPVGIDIAFSRYGIAGALLFVTLPFVVRTVQPVLYELDRDMEEAAASLGAPPPLIFRRVILPVLVPAILSGVAMSFARAIGEIGSVILISGNLPFKTQVSSVYITGLIESANTPGAAAVSVLLLAISFVTLLFIGAVRRLTTRHDA